MSICGLFSNFFTWQMLSNLKSPSLCVLFMVFCCILHCCVAFFFCDLRCFVAKSVCCDYGLLCGENFSQKYCVCVCGLLSKTRDNCWWHCYLQRTVRIRGHFKLNTLFVPCLSYLLTTSEQERGTLMRCPADERTDDSQHNRHCRTIFLDIFAEYFKICRLFWIFEMITGI